MKQKKNVRFFHIHHPTPLSNLKEKPPIYATFVFWSISNPTRRWSRRNCRSWTRSCYCPSGEGSLQRCQRFGEMLKVQTLPRWQQNGRVFIVFQTLDFCGCWESWIILLVKKFEVLNFHIWKDHVVVYLHLRLPLFLNNRTSFFWVAAVDSS